MSSKLYFEKFGNAECISQSTKGTIVQIKQNTNFKVILGQKNGENLIKLDKSLISGELFYDSGSLLIEPTQSVRQITSNSVMDLVTTPLVDQKGNLVEFEFQIFILTNLQDQFFRIKFTVIDQSQVDCTESIWSPLIQVLPRALNNSKKKRKISSISENDFHSFKSDILTNLTDQTTMIQRALLELNDRSQKITETRDLAVGIFIDGGLKSAFQRIFNAKNDEMIKELEEIKIINSDNLSQLYHLIGKVLKNHPRTDDEDSILFELGIDPKLLTESFSFFDKINGFS